MSNTFHLYVQDRLNTADAQRRAQADAAAIQAASSKDELELLLARLEAERACRALFKLQTKDQNAERDFVEDLEAIHASTDKSALELFTLRAKAQIVADEIFAMVRPL